MEQHIIDCYNIITMFDIDKEVYVNKGIQLSIFPFEGYSRYWIKGSVGCIEFDQDNFDALVELLVEYDKEINRKKARNKVRDWYGRLHGIWQGSS